MIFSFILNFTLNNAKTKMLWSVCNECKPSKKPGIFNQTCPQFRCYKFTPAKNYHNCSRSGHFLSPFLCYQGIHLCQSKYKSMVPDPVPYYFCLQSNLSYISQPHFLGFLVISSYGEFLNQDRYRIPVGRDQVQCWLGASLFVLFSYQTI